jgi:L-ascorbate metabolism protein UlaG (beta-lactamase superfamily)
LTRAAAARARGPGRLTFLGHSTVLIELAGTRILTDPALGHVMGSLRRHAPLVAPDLLERIDAVFISHGHFDHLDLPSLRSLNGRPEVVVPRGLGRVAAAARLGAVHEVAPGDRVRIGGVTIDVLEAAHGRHRLPWTAGVAATGCLISSEEQSGHGGNEGPGVYFAGDTDLFPAMAELAGRVDVALLPVGGWGPRLGRGHMDPERAAAAAALIRPAVAVPIHWGTLLPWGLGRFARSGLGAPGPAFAESVARLAPMVEAVVLAPGEAIAFGSRAGAAGRTVSAGAAR